MKLNRESALTEQYPEQKVYRKASVKKVKKKKKKVEMIEDELAQTQNSLTSKLTKNSQKSKHTSYSGQNEIEPTKPTIDPQVQKADEIIEKVGL